MNLEIEMLLGQVRRAAGTLRLLIGKECVDEQVSDALYVVADSLDDACNRILQLGAGRD